MVNILVPAAGGADFFEANYYPKPLVEIEGVPMIEHMIKSYGTIKEKHFVFVLSDEECIRFHLDNIVRLMTDGNADVIRLKQKTAGALCSSLIAIDYVDNDEPLIISNFDQITEVDFAKVLRFFEEQKADGGVISFPSFHPRWSYIRTEGENLVTEVAEKHPISKQAITGFYYYAKGHDFVEAAKEAIRKDNVLDGKFYISASMNEMILDGKKIVNYPIGAEAFHAFYSMDKINEYERMRGDRDEDRGK